MFSVTSNQKNFSVRVQSNEEEIQAINSFVEKIKSEIKAHELEQKHNIIAA